MTTLHLFFLAISAVFVLAADAHAFAYLRGTPPLLPGRSMGLISAGVWTGIIGLAASGAVMFWPDREYYLAEPAFLVKMAFVAALIVNGLAVIAVTKRAASVPFASLPPAWKAAMILSGGVSSAGWIGAAAIGFLWL